MTELRGSRVLLRPATLDDLEDLVAIRATPQVSRSWSSGDELHQVVRDEFADPDGQRYVVIVDGATIGMIQSWEERDAEYRHAGIDIYLDPAAHGRGFGSDAVRTLARHLLHDVGHHRLTIDPAADNEAAIRCYTAVGFRPVGVLREYWRSPAGFWRDGLLMELLASDGTL